MSLRNLSAMTAFLCLAAACVSSPPSERKRAPEGSTIDVSVSGFHGPDGVQMKSNTLVATVREGVSGDMIELGLVGQVKEDQLDLTVYVPTERSEGLASLDGSFELVTSAPDEPSQMRVVVGGVEYQSRSGEVTTRRQGKLLVGSFSAELVSVEDPSQAPLKLSGTFSGPLAVTCFARLADREQSGVILPNQDVLTRVGPENPFCAKFAP
jgi:hypothetical protein